MCSLHYSLVGNRSESSSQKVEVVEGQAEPKKEVYTHFLVSQYLETKRKVVLDETGELVQASCESMASSLRRWRGRFSPFSFFNYYSIII